MDCIRRPFSHCVEELSVGIPVHTISDLGRVPIWPPEGGDRNLCVGSDCHLGHSARVWAIFKRISNTSMLLLQAFVGIMSILSLVLASEVTEHRRSDERVRQLASSDPLTGLANYRRLLDVLDTEIKRHGRTGRIFAVLLLDLDGLKKINDAHGHLVGSRALCRLANILQIHCRSIDTAARYGGDEFVLLLPETDSEAARNVAHRISERLSEDGEEPVISASTGTAIFPQEGKTIDELLAAADRALYGEKRSSERLQTTRRLVTRAD
jgi:diguanylate cyclase (GGDEF)-like protein